MLITPQVLSDINARLSDAYAGAFSTVQPKWTKVAMDVPFDMAGLVLGWIGQAPQFREFVGERVIHDIEQYGYRVNPKKFETSQGLSISEINDGLIANKAKIAAAMGEAAAIHPDELVYGLLPANGLCYDGQTFFSNAHPGTDKHGNAVTFSNDMGGDGPAWYILKADSVIKPLVFGVRTGEGYTLSLVDSVSDGTVFKTDQILFGVRARVAAAYGPWQYALRSQQDLTKANVEAALAQMSTFRGDQGKPLNNDPTIIVVGPELYAAAKNIFSAERLANGGSNTLYNALEIVKSQFVSA